MTGLAGLAGFLIVGGLAFAFSGVRLSPIKEKPTSRMKGPGVERERLLAIAVGAAIGLIATRWPAMAAVGGIVGGLIPLGRRKTDDATRAEAIALWAEMLRDSVGSARGIESVLVGTAAAAPATIRADVQRAAARLPYDDFEDVMEQLAEDLAHPIGDLVVSAMRLAARGGGRQLREVLANLASAAHAEAESHRRTAVARQQPRSTMRTVIAAIGAFSGLIFLAAGDWMEEYSTFQGQVVLLFVAAWFAGGIYWMARMGRTPPVDRFFARRPEL